ncbi:hypothetical protein Lpar_2770 [Legionella parisiensis]|uniref:Uncharacterized protein n=1 Tax=Legionella parisiensis TaxID=45071 RepID=A0A1E5JMP9_9GAMM|nr:hypothetical protein Lpar_2770 [Legionella parisiensis]OEH45318.1 hypothetical protein lpari_03713 [Legionella parisiensis]STX76229.1 Uncharacterised protein [Legionella parisiensis]
MGYEISRVASPIFALVKYTGKIAWANWVKIAYLVLITDLFLKMKDGKKTASAPTGSTKSIHAGSRLTTIFRFSQL